MNAYLLFYVLGAIPTLILAILQLLRLKSGKASLGYDTDYELYGSFIRSIKRRKVVNGLYGMDWLPSDLIKMAIMGGLVWVILFIAWVVGRINLLINKIDGDEKD